MAWLGPALTVRVSLVSLVRANPNPIPHQAKNPDLADYYIKRKSKQVH